MERRGEPRLEKASERAGALGCVASWLSGQGCGEEGGGEHPVSLSEVRFQGHRGYS